MQLSGRTIKCAPGIRHLRLCARSTACSSLVQQKVSLEIRRLTFARPAKRLHCTNRTFCPDLRKVVLRSNGNLHGTCSEYSDAYGGRAWQPFHQTRQFVTDGRWTDRRNSQVKFEAWNWILLASRRVLVKKARLCRGSLVIAGFLQPRPDTLWLSGGKPLT